MKNLSSYQMLPKNDFLLSFFVTISSISGALLIKETAPVGTRIAKLVVTDRTSSELEDDLRFNLIDERVQKLPIFDRLPKRQIMFPGGQQIRVENGDSEEEFIDDQNDLNLGLPVDPINRHFAVSFIQNRISFQYANKIKR